MVTAGTGELPFLGQYLTILLRLLALSPFLRFSSVARGSRSSLGRADQSGGTTLVKVCLELICRDASSPGRFSLSRMCGGFGGWSPSFPLHSHPYLGLLWRVLASCG